MSFQKPPAPDGPNPPGVTPNQPKDKGVYGNQWGAVGGKKPKKAPQDRPNPISTPDEESGTASPDSPPIDKP
jgi:hypothetical protein